MLSRDCHRARAATTGDFFRDWAIAGGDPVAVLTEVAFENKHGDEATRHAQVADAVDAAVRSGDPHAYWLVAGVLMQPDFAGDPQDSFAWQLVACEYGLDCRMCNPQVGFGCVEHGTCNAEDTLLENMRTNFGLDVATEAEARLRRGWGCRRPCV